MAEALSYAAWQTEQLAAFLSDPTISEVPEWELLKEPGVSGLAKSFPTTIRQPRLGGSLTEGAAHKKMGSNYIYMVYFDVVTW